MLKTKTLLFALSVSVLTVGAAGLTQNKMSAADSAIEYRQSAFKLLKNHFGPMGAMVKGEMDYDAEVFAENADTVAMLAKLIAARGFPAGSEAGDELNSDALPDIWLDAEGFQSAAEAFLTGTAELAEAAKSNDMATIKPAFMTVAKSCKSCHDDYRE